MSHVSINQNVAEVFLAAGTTTTVTVKTNSPAVQKVELTGPGVDHKFSGAGENTLIGQCQLTGAGPFYATFSFQKGGQSFPSMLQSGGPYVINEYHALIVVAENGDDSDFNDAILQFEWRTKH
eukprot:Phypoly_transcript_23403.p1 GENE.Phypoly_transcript_23403~~Phypoly_transcript_23403.p1  ORF type:complete len:123 (+),score=15.64 Phypoly_transcript_23403:144-512(+)